MRKERRRGEGWFVVLVTVIAMALAVGLIAMTKSAQAQAMCGERSAVLGNLEKMYSETPVSMGLSGNGAVIEVLTSPSGSFTIILTRPNGLSCVMAAGENWEDLPIRQLNGPST